MKIINFLTIIFFFLFILTSQEPMFKQTERGGSNRLINRNIRESRNLKTLGKWKIAWGGKWKWEMFREKLRFSNFRWKIFCFESARESFARKLRGKLNENSHVKWRDPLIQCSLSNIFLAFLTENPSLARCCVTSNGTFNWVRSSSGVNSSPNNNKYLNCCSLWNLLKDLVCVSFKEFSYEKIMHVRTIHIIGDFISCLKNVYSVEDSFTVSA